MPAVPDHAGHPVPGEEPVTSTSPADAKIALFASLFRGRTDVYARRFESRKTGKSGNQPACANEWVPMLCGKPAARCSACPNRKYLPLTARELRWHLSGRDDQGHPFVAGVYPLLADERCHFLAIDLDGAGWRQDASALLTTCRRLRLPAALERSRSGDGGHLWLFFAEATPAHMARKLGAHLLTETMESRPELGLRSYDRMFPNQDTLPGGGLGNLIALPLQFEARKHGNSCFLDDSMEPVPDPWQFLSETPRIRPAQLEQLIAAASSRGRILNVPRVDMDEAPPASPPSPTRIQPVADAPKFIEISISNQIDVLKSDLPPALRNALVRTAAFQNPEFHRAQAMRLSVHAIPRVICCAEDHPLHLALPRGCLGDAIYLLESAGIRVRIRDERHAGTPIDLQFQGTLRDGQLEAAEALSAHETGVLAATTAFGKTVLAAWLIAKRSTNTLVLVHRQQLMEQWVERLAQFLDLPSAGIGRWGAGKHKLTGRVDVALIQSLVRKGNVDPIVENYGHLVVDECHHLSAHSFERVARRSKARYVTGLSATVTRKDGHHPVIFMQCGPVRHRVNARQQAPERPFTHEVLVRPTGFTPEGTPETDPRLEFQRLCDAVIHSGSRNQLIADEVAAAVSSGRQPVVLTERTEHLDALHSLLAERIAEVFTLKGGMGRKELKATLAAIRNPPDAGGRVILATGRFLGEGFDDSRLDTLFLTMPVSWHGTIAQYVGRLHRLQEGKRVARVYDYVDLDVPMLERMFQRRCQGYDAVGYTLLLPASALPGWPAEIPLPVDPKWKNQYAASVRRLIHDGVEPTLTRLFVAAAQPLDAISPGTPRSAAEAVLHARLESIPATAGRFTLNATLPIPFGANGRMEVDFLDPACRLAIEIDGSQHLGQIDAWRRDRRKDAALQAAGYFVLRFLTEDLAASLDHVLDTILATLETRQRNTHHPR